MLCSLITKESDPRKQQQGGEGQSLAPRRGREGAKLSCQPDGPTDSTNEIQKAVFAPTQGCFFSVQKKTVGVLEFVSCECVACMCMYTLSFPLKLKPSPSLSLIYPDVNPC